VQCNSGVLMIQKCVLHASVTEGHRGASRGHHHTHSMLSLRSLLEVTSTKYYGITDRLQQTQPIVHHYAPSIVDDPIIGIVVE
jgi:hypothetical protein